MTNIRVFWNGDSGSIEYEYSTLPIDVKPEIPAVTFDTIIYDTTDGISRKRVGGNILELTHEEKVALDAYAKAVVVPDPSLDNRTVRTQPQNLTPEQKAQARKNISALSDDDSDKFVKTSKQTLNEIDMRQARANIGSYSINGGELGDSIVLKVHGLAYRDVDNEYIAIHGGTKERKGGTINLYGDDLHDGNVEIVTGDTTVKFMKKNTMQVGNATIESHNNEAEDARKGAVIRGSHSHKYGAELTLNAVDTMESGKEGSFRLSTGLLEGRTKTLEGKPTGELQWGGKDVGVVDIAPSEGSNYATIGNMKFASVTTTITPNEYVVIELPIKFLKTPAVWPSNATYINGMTIEPVLERDGSCNKVRVRADVYGDSATITVVAMGL